MLVVAFHEKYVSSRFVETVVVGKAIVLASNLLPQVIALAAVPVIIICKTSSALGVPVRFVVKDVISTACAVNSYTSTLSVLIVGVADEVVLPVLAVQRLLVSVLVLLIDGIATPPMVGVVKLGLVVPATTPVPDSSLIIPNRDAELVAANWPRPVLVRAYPPAAASVDILICLILLSVACMKSERPASDG